MNGSSIVGTPVNPVSATQTSPGDMAENGVSLNYTGTTLQVGTSGHDIVLMASNLTGADSLPISTPNTVTWVEDLSSPIPILHLDTSISNPTNAASIKVLVDFGEDVMLLNQSFISTPNADLISCSVTATNRRWELVLAPHSGFLSGDISVIVGAGAFQDSVHNLCVESSPLVIHFDAISPNISAAMLNYIVGAGTVMLYFSESVYGDAAASLPINGAAFTFSYNNPTGNTLSLSFASHSAGSDTATFNLHYSGTPEGTESLQITIKPGAAVYDAAGNAIDMTIASDWLCLPDKLAPAAPDPIYSPGSNPPIFNWVPVSGATQYDVSKNGGTSWAVQIGTSFTWPAALPDGAYTFMAKAGDAADNWSDTATREFSISSVPAVLPRAIALVLDYSGSMNTQVVFGGISKPKKQWVQEAATAVFGKLMSHFSADYRLGLVCYATKAQVALPMTSKASLASNPALFTNALGSTPYGSSTAMGKGLAHTLNLLEYSKTDALYGAKRAIVLLADGQQNVQPKVLFPSGSPASFTIDTGLAAADCPPGMGIINVSGDRIPIHTCGIGGYAPWLEDLVRIASVSGGMARADNQIWPILTNYLVELTPLLFPDSSPQIIRNESGVWKEGQSYTFPVNAGVQSLTICLSWPGALDMDFSLYNGKTKVQFDRISTDRGLRIASIRFPHFKNARLPTTG
ncbi:hypothetical protein MASR2M78_22070 [Treponema sp.]